ncbi:sister chromatid cohesion protein Dcc1 [Aspergillus ambiguus]|uniref:putative sister chromatid cohesion protein Dcc1 n=1 Tax=Aspergillus ambiguus TaxID=176160 RepID=UPI003CCD16D7
MSTQSARSILFTHTSPQQGFKLLELPPELVDALSSKEPPTLEFKSPSLSNQDTAEAPTDRDFVHLCTPTQTYQVRQVQSSNSIHIIRPSNDDSGVQRGDINIVVAGEQDDDLNLVETMTAMAKCSSTLELYTPPGGFSAVPYLERMLRIYDRPATGAGEMAPEGSYNEQQRVIRGVFGDVPVSTALCERGWVEKCAFVWGRECWLPSARAQVDVWERMVEGAVLQGINLGSQFLVPDLWRAVLDEDGEAPFPRPLFEAVVRRVCEGEETGLGRLFDAFEMKWTSIDQSRCIKWIGETYLEAMAPSANEAVGRGEYLNVWRDHLPEAWRSEVAWSKLPDGSYKFPDPTTICFVNELDRQKLKKNVSTDASAATAAKKTRNWHELFKNQKRQKR